MALPIRIALSLACALALGGCLYAPYGGGYEYYADDHSYYRPYYKSHHHHRGKSRDREHRPQSFKPASPVGKSIGSTLRRFQRPR